MNSGSSWQAIGAVAETLLKKIADRSKKAGLK